MSCVRTNMYGGGPAQRSESSRTHVLPLFAVVAMLRLLILHALLVFFAFALLFVHFFVLVIILILLKLFPVLYPIVLVLLIDLSRQLFRPPGEALIGRGDRKRSCCVSSVCVDAGGDQCK